MKISKVDEKQQAVWNGVVIAESDKTFVADGYTYFPPGSVKIEFLVRNDHHSFCPWKGQASYYDIVVDGKVNHNAAWYYPDTHPQAQELKNWIGFWRGVEVKTAGL